MKRTLLRIIGYTVLLMLFATLLALELCCIASVIVAVAEIVYLIQAGLDIWAIMLAIVFAAIGLLSSVIAVQLPYGLATAWTSTAHRATGRADATG